MVFNVLNFRTLLRNSLDNNSTPPYEMESWRVQLQRVLALQHWHSWIGPVTCTDDRVVRDLRWSQRDLEDLLQQGLTQSPFAGLFACADSSIEADSVGLCAKEKLH